ncbi:MAG: hypothetical protein AAGB29_00585 [Planctomycetota bacterium]
MTGDPASETTNETAQATPHERLFAFLADQDVDCPRCDYNLRGTRSPMCPECGVELALRVAPANPKIAAYLFTVGSSAFGFGGSLVFGSIAATAAPPDWWISMTAGFMIASFVFSAVALTLSLIFRRPLLRCGTALRWTIAGVVTLLVAALSLGSIVTFEA